jgi:hypothetical protein
MKLPREPVSGDKVRWLMGSYQPSTKRDSRNATGTLLRLDGIMLVVLPDPPWDDYMGTYWGMITDYGRTWNYVTAIYNEFGEVAP